MLDLFSGIIWYLVQVLVHIGDCVSDKLQIEVKTVRHQVTMTDGIRTTLDMQSTDDSFSTESERWVQSFELKHDLMVDLSCKPKNIL